MTEHKKIIVFEGASSAYVERIGQQIHDMKDGDPLLMNNMPTIIDLEDVRMLSKDDVETWCKVHNMKLENK